MHIPGAAGHLLTWAHPCPPHGLPGGSARAGWHCHHLGQARERGSGGCDLSKGEGGGSRRDDAGMGGSPLAVLSKRTCLHILSSGSWAATWEGETEAIIPVGLELRSQLVCLGLPEPRSLRPLCLAVRAVCREFCHSTAAGSFK